MLVKTFEYVHDPDWGNGWLELNAPDNYNPGGGRVVAHDLLEHFPNTIDGRPEHEFMALGASLYIRGENGYFTNRGPDDAYSLDIAYTTLPGMADNNLDLEPLRTYKLGEEYADDKISHSVRKGIKQYMKEWEYEQGDIDPAIRLKVKRWCDSNQESMISWMRRGYRKAVERFGHHVMGQPGYVFKLVEDRVDSDLARMRFEEGTRMKLSVNIDMSDVRVTYSDPWEYDYYG